MNINEQNGVNPGNTGASKRNTTPPTRDELIQLLIDISAGNPGAMQIAGKLAGSTEAVQLKNDLELLAKLGIKGHFLYHAFQDVKDDYVKHQKPRDESYQHPYLDLTPQKMMELIRNGDKEYFDYLNEVLEVNGFSERIENPAQNARDLNKPE